MLYIIIAKYAGRPMLAEWQSVPEASWAYLGEDFRVQTPQLNPFMLAIT